MGVSKVEYNGETLIDLTGDTVTPETLAEGATAHDMAGNPITGTMKQNSGGSGAVQEIDYVNCVFDLSTFSVVSVDKTYAEIVEMIEAGKYVVTRTTYALVAAPVNVAYFPLSAWAKEQDLILFTGLIQANIGNGAVILSLSMHMYSSNDISVKARVVSTTDLN